jgi:phosphoglycerate kinase
MPAFRTLDEFDLKGRRVLVRTDLNLPMMGDKVADLTRLVRTAGTIKELADAGAKVIVMSHFGRPTGPDPKLSLRKLLPALADALPGIPVAFAEDCIGPVAEAAARDLAPGAVLLLENLRFHAGEEADDPAFVASLAKLGELYVNDGFAVSHRAHASIAGLALALPAAAGRLMQAELEALNKALGSGSRDGVVALVGGSKVSTKLEILTNLVVRVDALVIGGAMANTFLFAQGRELGLSLVEKGMADTARDILARAEKQGCEIILPIDVVVARALQHNAATQTVTLDRVEPDRMILDIGPKSVRAAAERFAKGKVLVWNGPVGAFEIPPFDAGTTALAREAASLTEAGKLVSVAGGGDTVAALAHADVAERFTYVSTAGGAFLEWLEGKELPGVAALQESAKTPA